MSETQQTATGLYETILNRRSLRRYLPDPVPRELIERLLRAAVWAPSAHNRQPWRFAVVSPGPVRARLAEAMGQRLRADLQADLVPEEIIIRETERSWDRLTSAPLLLVLCLTMQDMDQYPDEMRNRNEYLMAVQSVAMSGQNILLMAHDAGLAACWMCAPLFCPDVVVAQLDLPEDWQPQGFITLGYPAQERSRTREEMETRILWR